MSIDFPNSPTLNQTFSTAGKNWQWDGTAWQLLAVAPDAILKSILDAKGDLVIGTAADTVGRLGVGTNGQVLTASSSTNEGLTWSGINASNISSGTLAVARGGTGVTTSSGTGSVVLSTSPTFTGTVTSDNYKVGLTTLGSNSIALDFSSGDGFLTRTATETITFSGTNYLAGVSKTIRIVAGASSRTLSFPSGWIFLAAKPASLAANKVGVLTITSFGTTEQECVAAWGSQD